MVRAASIGIGAVLLVLGAIGLGVHAAAWLVACDLIGALLAGVVAWLVPAGAHGDLAVGLPVVLGLSLSLVWLVALAARADAWLTWVTFAAALAFCLVAVAAMPGGMDRSRLSRRHVDPPR